MRFSNRLAASSLVLISALVGIVCVWVVASRSTILTAFDSRVISLERKLEHAPGVDDVFLVTLETSRVLHVDELAYKSLRIGAAILKHRWEKTLWVEGNAVSLTWSRDTYAMLIAMPLFAILACAGLLVPRASLDAK